MGGEEAMSKRDKIQANAEKKYTITSADLPLCCPTEAMKLWNSHPRVCLPIAKTGQER